MGTGLDVVGAPGLNPMRHMEQCLEALAETPMTAEQKLTLLAIVDDFVFGHALREAARYYDRPGIGGGPDGYGHFSPAIKGVRGRSDMCEEGPLQGGITFAASGSGRIAPRKANIAASESHRCLSVSRQCSSPEQTQCECAVRQTDVQPVPPCHVAIFLSLLKVQRVSWRAILCRSDENESRLPDLTWRVHSLPVGLLLRDLSQLCIERFARIELAIAHYGVNAVQVLSILDRVAIEKHEVRISSHLDAAHARLAPIKPRGIQGGHLKDLQWAKTILREKGELFVQVEASLPA
jgi:hypothetical protein